MIEPVSSLAAAGYRGAEVGRRQQLVDRAARGLGSAPELVVIVPGRIEVLGKHTDYAGGRSLLVATEQGFAFAARRRPDGLVRAASADGGAAREAVYDSWPAGSGTATAPEHRGADFGTYLAAVIGRLGADFGPGLAGMDLAFASDLPVAAGVSSSSALVIGIGLAAMRINRLGDRPAVRGGLGRPEDLAAYFGAVENGRGFRGFEAGRGVGTLGGNQDQTAILCARPDAVAQYRYEPTRLERAVPLPADLAFVVAASGVRAEKAGAALERYNRLAQATAALTRLAAEAVPEIDGTLVDRLLAGAAPRARIRLAIDRAVVDSTERTAVHRRLDQLTVECDELIPAMATALEANDRGALGPIAARSHRLASEALGNEIPETAALVDLALSLGSLAASGFGAGFGGSVWALVPTADAPRFAPHWRAAYSARFPQHAPECQVAITRPAPPAAVIESP